MALVKKVLACLKKRSQLRLSYAIISISRFKTEKNTIFIRIVPLLINKDDASSNKFNPVIISKYSLMENIFEKNEYSIFGELFRVFG